MNSLFVESETIWEKEKGGGRGERENDEEVFYKRKN